MRTIQRFNIMPIIEMIPPEYWRQIRKELNALGDDLNPAELARLESESQRRNRIAAEYDSAIERRRIENNRLKRQRYRRK